MLTCETLPDMRTYLNAYNKQKCRGEVLSERGDAYIPLILGEDIGVSIDFFRICYSKNAAFKLDLPSRWHRREIRHIRNLDILLIRLELIFARKAAPTHSIITYSLHVKHFSLYLLL